MTGMEFKLIYLFYFLSMPVALTVSCLLLYTFIGLWGLLAIGIPIVVIPLQGLIGKKNG